MHRVPKRFGLAAFLMLMIAILGGSPLEAQSKRQEFLAAFKNAVAKNDFSRQRSLVGQNKDEAFGGFFDLEADLLKARVGNDTEAANKAYSQLEALAGAYRLEFSEAFLNDRFRWANGLEGEAAQGRIDAYNSYWNGVQSQAEGDNGNEEAYRAALESYSNTMLACAKIKDQYWAAMAANYMSGIHNKFNEYFEAAYYALWAKRFANEGGISGRSEFNWIDGYLGDLNEKRRVVMPELIDTNIGEMDKAKAAHQKAVEAATSIPAGGEGSGNKGEGGTVLAAPKASNEYEWVDHKMKHGVEKNAWTKLKLPYWNARYVSPTNNRKDPFFQYAQFEKDAEPVEFGAFPGGKAEYDGNLNFRTDADKKNKVKVKSNKFAKLDMKVRYDDDREAKITHMIMDYEAEWLELFGTKFNASDSAKFAMVAWYGISTVSGKVFGTEVEIIDTNGNGMFRDFGEDSVVIGKGRNARVEPLGRYLYLPEEGGWYPYQVNVVDKDGTTIRTRPYKGSLAPIHVKFKTGSGEMPQYLVAKGTGEDVEFYFDLMKGLDPSKPIWVPEGRYEIYQGYFTFGSGKKETNLLIGKGRSGTFPVEAGKLNVWELGGAGEKGFWMIGNVHRSPEKKSELISVGKDIQVFGNFGEQYFNFYVERLTPTVTIHRDSADGRKVGEEDMRLPGGDNIQMVDLWYPANCTIKNAPTSADLWAQLTAKHGKLGQITSEWFRVVD